VASQLFDGFNDRAHLAVVLADREARALGCPLVDLEHLLLGVLVSDPELQATLAVAGLAVDALRTQVVAVHGADAPLGRGDSEFSAASREVLRGVAIFARRKDREVTCSDIAYELLNGQHDQLEQLLSRAGAHADELRRSIARRSTDTKAARASLPRRLGRRPVADR
jgi:ATP-dependent Clp protease ATP-binding subunit ClpA